VLVPLRGGFGGAVFHRFRAALGRAVVSSIIARLLTVASVIQLAICFQFITQNDEMIENMRLLTRGYPPGPVPFYFLGF
jgi:hypothetical protein